MMVLDQLSKYAHFVALSHPYTTFLVAQVFVKKLLHLHWMPRKIIRDSDKIFISQFLARILPSQGTQLCMSNAYHPWSNGQTEVVHRCSETYLPFVKDIYILQELNLDNGPSGFYEFEWWYNTTFQASIQTTSFEVLYGHPPPTTTTYKHEILQWATWSLSY